MRILTLNERQRCDLELLLTGGFAPLSGYLGPADYETVLTRMRLADGRLWPMPIVLDVDEAQAGQLAPGVEISLQRPDGLPLATITVEEWFRPDLRREALAIYGTDDPRHPGVAALFARGPVYVSGPLRISSEERRQWAAATDFPPEYRSPAELRRLLNGHPTVAFQTRNPLHFAHMAITQKALAQVEDGQLLLHPAVGPTKPGDVDAAYRMRAYRLVLSHYPAGRVHLAALPLAMRMAGPREALWHALIRRNYGATHFIVGRGHADPGGLEGGLFYPPFAAQDLLAAHADEAGIAPIFVGEHVYSARRRCYVTPDELEADEPVEQISGTELRRRLANREAVPEWFSPPEVIACLRQAYRGADNRGLVLWLTGLSGSGKSTMAGMLARRLEAMDQRTVTLLDGDVIRRFLSKGLGFSKADRDENIRRIGFVASLAARHGGIAIVSAISPYRRARAEARALVEENGGLFVEIHAAASLQTCLSRDAKGLYARAIAGAIDAFTGIDDPYEKPLKADIQLDTARISPPEATRRILQFLIDRGFLCGIDEKYTDTGIYQ
ncbi:MAG: sulfate adenylyltransferase [Acidithiobacillus sp.]